ncbi:MAG: dienelactone hydrolase family protein [Dongiaceae bacterium]
MTEIRISARTPDAKFGAHFMAYQALPKNAGKAPVIIVIQEIFGVNSVMRAICNSLAETGYIAICPDLFWRQQPGIQLTDQSEKEWQKAFALFNGFNIDLGVEDLIATLDHARTLQEGNGKVGTLGYCLGGKLAYLMATRSDADCNVSYYGVGIQDLLDEAKNIKHPYLMHIAGKDKFVPPDAIAKIRENLSKHPHVTMYIYDEQDHAFARVGGEHYDAAAAGLANKRTAEFLGKNLK